MRETLAENRFQMTRELFFEGMARVWAAGARKSIGRWLLLLGGLWLAFTVYTLLQGGSLLFPLMELGVLGAVILWCLVFLPRGRARRAWNALEAQGRANTQRCTRFYEDRLEAESGGQTTEVSYAEINRILRSEHLLLLITENKTGILLKHDGYTRGTEETVLRLCGAELYQG